MKKMIKLGLSILIILSSALLLFYGYAYFSPTPLLGQESRIRIYDIHGDLMYESNFSKTGEWVNIEKIPQVVQDAVVSVEDKRFYQHIGFDPIRIVKAMMVNIQEQRKAQGGSTITQQYARNVFLNLDQTYSRKVKEIFYAAKLETHFSKQQILEGYLNTVYFGHGIYGIQKASNYFFNKELDELSLAEASMLVGIPNGPSLYSPYLSMENSKKRQKTVLNSMLTNNKITQDEHNNALNTTILLANREEKTDNSLSGYYKDTVIQQVKQMGYLQDEYLNKGIDVYTYYDPNIQSVLKNATLKGLQSTDAGVQIASVVVQPFTGNVMAMMGGNDYTQTQYNRVTNSQRQVGSTIKPLLYYLALLNHFTPSTTFLSQPTTFSLENGETYAPINYKEIYPDMDISMIHAISLSDNIYAVKTHLYLGVNTLKEALSSFQIDGVQPTASLALGATNFPLIDLARIYNTFASEGLYNDTAFISYIQDGTGKTLYERKIEPKQLLQRDETLILTSLLRAPFDIKNNYKSTPSLLGFEPYTTVAAKSGSSDWDSLVAGYNPEYTLVVWSGYDENKSLDSYEQRKGPKVVFQTFYNTLYSKDTVGPWYQMSNQLEERTVDPITGQPNPTGSTYWYKREAIPE